MKKRHVVAAILALALSMTETGSANSQQAFRGVGYPRDGDIHANYVQVVNNFNANAQARNLPIRLFEDPSTVQESTHIFRDKGITIMISETTSLIRSMDSISIDGWIPRKEYTHKRNPPFDKNTYMQYIDCMIQTLEPQFTPQERTNLLGRLGLLRFATPKEYRPYWLKFEHNALEYLFKCKGRDETGEVYFYFHLRGSTEPPVNVDVIPGAINQP